MSNRPRVLIVEDDAELRASMADLLRAAGYEVDAAANGAEGINHLEGAARPRVIVMDLVMPGVVGQELLEYLRDDVVLAAIPVAIYSGSPDLAPTGYRVFRKPLDMDALLEFVRGCAPAAA